MGGAGQGPPLASGCQQPLPCLLAWALGAQEDLRAFCPRHGTGSEASGLFGVCLLTPFQTLPAPTSAALLGRPELAGAGGQPPQVSGHSLWVPSRRHSGSPCVVVEVRQVWDLGRAGAHRDERWPEMPGQGGPEAADTEGPGSPSLSPREGAGLLTDSLLFVSPLLDSR